MGKNKVSSAIDGQCDEKNIADRFATVFSSACVPNSETRHAELFEKVPLYSLWLIILMHVQTEFHVSY